jgi:iron(III) transport system substrate-binding protein
MGQVVKVKSLNCGSAKGFSPAGRKKMPIDANRASVLIISAEQRSLRGFTMAHVLATLGFCLVTIPLLSSLSWAQNLQDSAKKEGQVVFYASMEAPSAQKLTAAFERRHPYIKVESVRIGSERMATRLIAEAQARKVRADVVHQSAFDFYGVLQKALFESYLSPERAGFPAEYRDEKGLWVMASATLNVIAYNRKMVGAADVPRSFWDLAGGKWKNQLLMDDNESKWMAGMMQYHGEAKTVELLKLLAAQDIQFRTGHSTIQTLLAAGERAAVVVAFANGVDRLKKEGAPIDWIAADPVIGLTFGTAVVKDAPHPSAARLFNDFLLSREGQEISAAAGYYVPRSDVASPILKEAPPKTKVMPLAMTLAPRYNEYFLTYRKLMGLK